jgi:DNA-binding transcriptional LysR family regulator
VWHKLSLMLDPRRLLTFRAAARAGSFTRAAEGLALTQSAVSQQVGGLERQLGVELVRRGRRGLTLTETGALLLEHADAVADRLALADRQVAERARAQHERLRLGAFPSALAGLVPAAIAALRASAPEAQVEARDAPIARLHELVRAGELHVAICFGDVDQLPPERHDRAGRSRDVDQPPPERHHPPEPSGELHDVPGDGLRRHELFVEPLLAALAPGHPLANAQSIPLAALADEDWLAPSPDHLTVRACRAAGFEPRLTYLTTDPAAIRALCAGGLAVALVPRLLEDHMPGVALVPIAPDPPVRRVYAITPDAGVHPVAAVAVAALRRPGSAAASTATA